MCAIAGIFGREKPLAQTADLEIAHLLGAQAHRGPDATRHQRFDERTLLGSARLRVTDALNPDADMPMVSNCGRYVIIYNGQVYNHLELRQSLNYDFRTRCDTETVLVAWIRWGTDCLTRFEGMFAFCIYDLKNREAFFAVDPSGQKFLYHLQDKDAFVFASEIQALISDPFREKNWDTAALQEYVSQRMIIGADTHIREIKKLEAGTHATLKNGALSIRRYYTIPVGDQARDNIPDIAEGIAAALETGCKQTFDLEVSAGHLLSGGIDSSTVAWHAKQAGQALETYSIGFARFEGESFGIPTTFNEFDYARFMAQELDANHHEIAITPEEYCRLIDRWVEIIGEPLDSTEAPMLIRLFEETSKNHRVVFCGSGPDEAFDGYGLGKKLTDVSAGDVAGAYYDRFNWAFSVDLDRLMPKHEARAQVVAKMEGFLAPYRALTNSPLQLAQLINLHGRCVAYEYRQLDVISMRHSVEARCPLADTRLTRAAFNFNPSLKQHLGQDKWVYKQAMRGKLPDRIVDREKTGFPTPIEFWFTDIYEGRVHEAFKPDSALFTLGILDGDYLRRIWSTRQPQYRLLGNRLFTLNRLIERQGCFIGAQAQEKRAA